MNRATPGFSLNKIRIDDEKKKDLSPADLKSQIEREVHLGDAVNEAYQKSEKPIWEQTRGEADKAIVTEIQQDANKENLHRAKVHRATLMVKRRMDITEKEAQILEGQIQDADAQIELLESLPID